MFRGHSLPHRRRLLPRVVRPTIAIVLSLTVIAGLFTGPLQAAQAAPAPATSPDTNPSDFPDSQTIAINNAGNPALTNFQVKVSLNSSNFNFSKAQSSGADLRFYASDGATPLNFWTANYSASSQTATIWVEVPSLSAGGTGSIVMRYGNPSATSASNGDATFPFFDNFSNPSESSSDYFSLSAPQTVIVQDQSYETSAPHTMSIVSLNLNGYKYYSYYGPQGEGWIGLAASNDLVNWTKLGQVADLSGTFSAEQARWPSAMVVGNTIYVAMEENYSSLPSQIGLYETSVTNPSQLTRVETLIAPQGGHYDQNPYLWFDPNNGQYYIYWYSDSLGGWSIMARSASTIPALATASNVAVLRSSSTLAAPNMMYENGTYYLGTEIEPGSTWQMEVFASTTSPTSGFAPLADAPELPNGAACPSQNVVGSTLYLYDCQQTNGVWTITLRTANLSVPPGQSSIPNTSEWTASGGTWQVLTATGTTLPSGSNDVAVQGTTSTPFQILKSTYTTGSSYVLDAYGEQISGRVWGLGVGAQSNNTFDSINLYDDLNSTNNLYAYKWTSGRSTTIANAAVGTVNSGQWYELTAKVNGPSISVYLNNNLELQGSDSALQPGSIALYGEGGVEQFANVFVRQYAPTDPTVTVSPAAAGTPQSISFTSTPPTSAAVGGTPYTVTATGGGSGNPVVFSIDSSASSVCSISGSTVSFTAVGTCTIDANQAGNSTYSPAPQAQQSLSVGVDTKPSDFPDSQTIAINNAGNPALTNFQVKVSLNSSNFNFSQAQSSGADLRFYASDGATPLNFWTANYSASTQTATIWVEVPSLSAGGTGSIVMRYGNPSATSASNGNATFPFFDNFSEGSINGSTWAPSGGTWQVVSSTLPSGSTGVAAQGSTSLPNEILKSTYTTGSSYVLDAYGKQVSGRVWGLGVGAQSNNTFDSINLYDDLNSTNNLYAYNWTNGSATTIANAAVGTVNSGQWYELTAKVNGPSISVYLNNNLELQGSDSALQPGSIALYGEGGVQQFTNVFVRQYAPTDPTVTVP